MISIQMPHGPARSVTRNGLKAQWMMPSKKFPVNKLILALAGFGYDWKMDENDKVVSATPISYQDALTLALSYDGKIIFDNDSYNLHFTYDDDNGAPHKVHFTDAATTFNSMRFAEESGSRRRGALAAGQ